MNILKSFELFFREPFSILRERFIQIVNINSDLVTQASVNVDLLDQKTQITVVNSEKMYNLLKTVQHRRETKAAQKLMVKTTKKQQVVLGQLFGRM